MSMCRVQKWTSHFRNYFPFIVSAKISRPFNKRMLDGQPNAFWNFFMTLHRYAKQVLTMCCVRQWQFILLSCFLSYFPLKARAICGTCTVEISRRRVAYRNGSSRLLLYESFPLDSFNCDFTSLHDLYCQETEERSWTGHGDISNFRMETMFFLLLIYFPSIVLYTILCLHVGVSCLFYSLSYFDYCHDTS